MIAVPIGPRQQRYAVAASPGYLAKNGHPQCPRDLLNHACNRGCFASGAMTPWKFARETETIRIEPSGPLIVRVGAATKLAVDAARSDVGILRLCEGWLQPHLTCGAHAPVLPNWWQRFSGPVPYHPGRRLLPAPLRAFVDDIKEGRPLASAPPSG